MSMLVAVSGGIAGQHPLTSPSAASLLNCDAVHCPPLYGALGYGGMQSPTCRLCCMVAEERVATSGFIVCYSAELGISVYIMPDSMCARAAPQSFYRPWRTDWKRAVSTASQPASQPADASQLSGPHYALETDPKSRAEFPKAGF